jgi:formylglycine-generating enzyme required for sulfatase activity
VPGDDPFLNLALALTPPPAAMGAQFARYMEQAQALAADLSATPQALTEHLEQTYSQGRVLLFIDQFEETFTLAEKNAHLPAGYVATFLQALNQTAERITVLLTMRADFYGAALPHFEALQQEAYGLKRPSTFALLELITRPAELAGLRFDPGLAGQIIEDTGSESGALALISYVLEALYLRAKARGDGRLSRQDYTTELGGVQGAINTLADKAYQSLPLEEAARQTALKAVFREFIALTEEDGQLIPTRRRSTQLTTLPADSDEKRMVDAFVDARLLVNDGHSVEVAHEAILRNWGALADWIGSIKGDLALYRQYERDAKTWDDRGRDTPPPPHEALVFFYKALGSLEYEWDSLDDPLQAYTRPEQERLLRELETLPRDATSHERRRDIGDRLAVIGDTRPGVGVKDDLPDILWLPVTPGGEIKIEKDRFNVQPFYIACYLISHSQFEVFLAAADGFRDDRWWARMPDRYQKQEMSPQRTKIANAPRDTLSWYQAVAFARWLTHRYQGVALPDPAAAANNVEASSTRTWIIGKNTEIRLPTEWEWQWAAQNGMESRAYPWGNWAEGHANTSEAGLSRTTAVGLYLPGSAACGALDMAGNLWEWCLNDYKNPTSIKGFRSGERKVLRGGAFRRSQNRAATSCRDPNDPNTKDNPYGFRLVLGAPIASLTSASETR